MPGHSPTLSLPLPIRPLRRSFHHSMPEEQQIDDHGQSYDPGYDKRCPVGLLVLGSAGLCQCLVERVVHGVDVLRLGGKAVLMFIPGPTEVRIEQEVGFRYSRDVDLPFLVDKGQIGRVPLDHILLLDQGIVPTVDP